MGTIALDEIPKMGVGARVTSSGISTDDALNMGKSNSTVYTAPQEEPMPIQDRLARGFTRTIAEAPQVLGQGIYYLGSNINPGASREEQMQGLNFGDRIARAGLVMTERNKKYIAEHYPENPDIWENVGGAVPAVGVLALGALTGFTEAAAATLAVGGGASAQFSAFNRLKEKGKSTNQANIMSELVGAGTGSAMAVGIGNFLKVTGPIIPRIAKSIINGFTGGVVQSVTTGSLELATGVTDYNGTNSLKELMSNAVQTGITFAILGGPLGAHMALVEHNAVKEGYKQLGLSDKAARDATRVTMAQGMHEGLKAVEKEINPTKEELSRIKFNPLFQPKPIDESGAPRLDSLDIPFEPKEPSRTELLTSDLEAKKKNLELIKKDIKDLQTELKGNELDQRLTKLNLDKQADITLSQLQKEANILKDQIENLKERLRPKTNALQEVSNEITRIKQGFRQGKTLTKGEIEFVQKEFNNLIDASDLSLADKAKFRSAIPRIQSEEDFFKAFPEVVHRINLLEQRAEQKEWVEDINKIDLKKLPVDYQDVLKPILSSFDFSRPSKNKIIARAKTIDFFRRKLAEIEPGAITEKGEVLLSPGEQRALDDASRLSMTEILAQPDGHERLRAIHDMIMSMAHDGKMKSKYVSNLKQRDHEEWVAETLIKLKDPRNIERLDNLEKALQQKNQKPWQWLWGWKNALQHEQMHPELLLDILGMNNEHQVLHEAFQQEIQNREDALKILDKIHNTDDVQEALHKKLDLKAGDKVYKGITGMELLKIYAQSFDEGGYRHLENTFDGKNTLKDLLIKTKELFPDQVNDILKQFEYFRTEGFDRLDKVVVVMEGHHMTKVDFYDPIGNSLEDRAGRDLQNDMKLGVRGMMGRALPESGMTKARVKSKLAFDKFDYYGDLVRNAMDREHYIALAPVLRDLNKKFYDPRITTAISDVFKGPDGVRIIHKWLRDIAYDGHLNDSKSAKMLAQLRSTFMFAKVGGNIFSAGKVFSQLFPAADYVGHNRIWGAARDYMFNREQLDKFIDDNSLMLKNRYTNYGNDRDFQNLINDQGIFASTPEKARTNLIKLGMWMHQEADKIVTRVTFLGEYNKNKAAGFTGIDEKAAIAAAEKAVRYTHPMGGTMYLPDVFRGNAFQKAMTTFHNATNRNFNLLIKSNREFSNTPEEYLKYARSILNIGILPAIVLATLNLRRKSTARETALEYWNQTTGSDIWWGVMTTAALSGREAAATNPWTAPLIDATTAIKAKEGKTKLRYGLATLDDITGLPTANIFRTITGQMFKSKGHEGWFHQMDSDEGSVSSNPLRAGGI